MLLDFQCTVVSFCILQLLGVDIPASGSFWHFLGYCMEANPSMCMVLRQPQSLQQPQLSSSLRLLPAQCCLLHLDLHRCVSPTMPNLKETCPATASFEIRLRILSACCLASRQFSEKQHYYRAAGCISPPLSFHVMLPFPRWSDPKRKLS